MATTPKTVKTYDLDGTKKDFTIPFEYLARKFVVVTLVGTDRRTLVLGTDYRFSSATQITTLRGSAWGPGDGYEMIEIRRFTSATERLVDFVDGSILRAYDLNIAQVQSLHIAEEARDLTADTIAINNDGNLDARGKRIVNLADGVDPGDAVTMRQQASWADSALSSANKAKASELAAKASENAAQSSEDAAAASAQELEDLYGSVIRVPGGTLDPLVGDRAGRVFGFDDQGQPKAYVLDAGSNTALSGALNGPDGTTYVKHGSQVLADVINSLVYAVDGGTNGRRHVRSFGVKADGVTVDDDAVLAAMTSPYPLDWGSGTIVLSKRITAQMTRGMDWNSDGITFKLVTGGNEHYVLDILLMPGTENKIVGSFNVDANEKASVGVRFYNQGVIFPTSYCTLSIDGVNAQNIYRWNNTAAGGDGIIIRGGFWETLLVRCKVRNVHMAAGAGVVGSVGVTGITVSPQADAYSLATTCRNLVINGIKSDDPSVRDDQDGLRVFGGWGTRAGISENMFTVEDSSFTDCYGRSIKAQTDSAFISKCKFVAYGGPTGGRNQDVDLQVGGGVIRDNFAYYSGAGATPDCILSFQPAPSWESFSGEAHGMKVRVASGLLKAVVATYPRARTQHRTVISGVDVIGSLDVLLEARNWGSKANFEVRSSTVNSLATSLVRLTASGAGGSPFTSKVEIDGVDNHGPAVPLVVDSVVGAAAKATVSDSNCNGFTTNLILNDTSPKGGVQRIPARAGVGDISGVETFESRLMANNEVWDFGTPGYGQMGKIDIATNAGLLARGSVAFSASGSVGTSALSVGADLSVGGKAEPATGTFRIWLDTSLKLKNVSGASRVVTVKIFG